jgi:carbon storage regulator
MLVLSRRLGERILIGENISITVVDIDRGKIRLGIEAPRDVSIWRKELLEKNMITVNTIGTLPPRKKYRGICENCKCDFDCDEDDIFTYGSAFNGEQEVFCLCPREGCRIKKDHLAKISQTEVKVTEVK